MPRGLGNRLMMGGIKNTYFNTTVPDGHYEGGYVSVPVYYYTYYNGSTTSYWDTAYLYDTTYAQSTSASGTRETWHQTGFQVRPFPEPEWTSFPTYYNTSYSTSYTTSWPVTTWYPVQTSSSATTTYSHQTYYYSDRYTEHWTDTSYARQTWRETTW